VVEGMISDSGYLWHWLMTGRATGHEISAPITPRGMYFYSTSHPSPLTHLLSDEDTVGWC